MSLVWRMLDQIFGGKVCFFGKALYPKNVKIYRILFAWKVPVLMGTGKVFYILEHQEQYKI